MTTPYISDPRIMQHDTLILPADAVAAAQGGLPDLAMFGVNFTGKCYEDWRWHNSTGYLSILTKYHHPAALNLTGAEQYHDALKRAVDVRSLMPQTRVLWRHMIHQPPGATENTDRGLWRLPPMEYVDNIVMAHGTAHLYNVTDCEGHIDAHEIKTYAQMEAARLDYGVPKGARFAVLRMSTHNPLPAILDSGDLDPLLQAIGRNMGTWDDPKVVISNNGYFDDTDNEDGLLTARRIEQRCMTLFKFRPVVVMGEYGFDKGFTSVHGWRVSGMNGAQMVGKVIDHAQYIAGMAACVYGVGFSEDAKVKTFHLDNAELELLMKLSPVYAPPGPVVILEPPTEEPPVITPPPVEVAFKPGKLKRASSLRKEKGLADNNPAIEVLPVDWPVEYMEIDPLPFISSYYWLEIMTTLKNGEHARGFIALTGPAPSVANQITPTVEEVPDEPEPEDPPPPPDPVYITLTEAQQMVDAKAEAVMSYMKEWTLALLIEYTKADSTALLAKIELLNPIPLSKAS